MKDIYREIVRKVHPWCQRKEIIFFLGARQVGKTTLMKYFETGFKDKGFVTFFMNLEDPDVLKLTEDVHLFVRALSLDTKNDTKKIVLFLDEIQLHPNPSHFLKFLYDEYGEKIKIFVSGSAQWELKSLLQDSLAGRKIDFNVTPFTFSEFCAVKSITFSVNPLTNQTQKEDLLEEYLLYGGLPEVVKTNEKPLKIALLKRYTQDYIQKDIRALVQEKNIAAFNQLNVYLAKIIGNLKTNSSISNHLKINHQTLQRYLDIFRHTFVYSFVSPFLTNEISRLRKNEKVYIFDNGIRNALLSNFTPIEKRNDSGALFENFFYNELQKLHDKDQIFYLRTQSGNEVDFVCRDDFGNIEMMEVKYMHFDTNNIPKGTKILTEQLSYNIFKIINLNYTKKISDKVIFESVFESIQ